MITENFWSINRFPILYENNIPKAVMVDIESYKKIGMILDSLMKQNPEIRDMISADSANINSDVKKVLMAAEGIFGLWKDRETDVEAYIRNMRTDRAYGDYVTGFETVNCFRSAKI
ncbi:MAG: hypothetical protein BWK80_31045 [Desulfobacteraceae bacterium IS3]|nr:MAG: hypothetical protein BWK80_31045 [Desulfobacteraceae bacterium IS3]